LSLIFVLKLGTSWIYLIMNTIFIVDRIQIMLAYILFFF